jgi:cell division protein FtsW (lipid II flippase)/cell division protein FtsI/penicillin-binding protein 2
MRVITPADAGRVRPASRVRRSLNIELLGLLVATCVVMGGLALARAGKAGRLGDLAPAGTIVPLHALEGPAAVEPLLTMFPSTFERQSVGRAIYRRATAVGAPLEHVGGLAGVTIPASEVRADRRFVELRARLERRPDAPDVPVLTQGEILAMKPRFAVRTIETFDRRLAGAAALFLAAFWFAHAFRRWRRRIDDPVLLPAVMLLSGIGLIAMVALRDPLRDTIAAVPFAWGVAGGLLVLVAASELDFEASPIRRSVLVPLGAALALAALLLIFGSGPGTSGVKVNLFGVQPVEAIRLLVVFALAAYFGRRIELLRELSEPATPARPWLRHVRLPRWRDVRPVLVSMALVLAFFFLQKDLGPALVLSCVFLAMYGIGRGHVAFVLTGFALLLAGFTVAYWIGTPATVRGRVMIWSDPWNNGVPGGNHIAHGLWALSTGATWGSGPGLGNPESIPAAHTDFVLAAAGEELGFVGLAAIVALYAIVCWRCLRAALRAPGDYSAFLAVGVALTLAVQALVIASGLLAVVPLSGVVTPFLSFGRSSMIANCLAVGIVLAVARRQSPVREHLRQPMLVLGTVLALAAVALAARAAWIQVLHADDYAAASSLSEQADGGYRFEHNPRLLAAARTLVRGTIYDRNGVPLATSRPDEIASIEAIYRAAGLPLPYSCAAGERCYPLGGLAFHLLGDWTTQANWSARNSSYIERDSDARLKGYDDRARLVEVVNPRTGRRHQSIQRDFRELLPLVRERYRRGSDAVRALVERNRDLETTIDARLQLRAATTLRDSVEAAGQTGGAAIVLDAATGEILASASYPWPTTDVAARHVEGRDSRYAGDDGRAARLLDRARYGLYPPGSTFKVLVAAAALRANAETPAYQCVRLPGGRVGNFIRGWKRPVRDDPLNKTPHGTVDLERGIVASCNAYFAQLALGLGPEPLVDAAAFFQIDLARVPTAHGLASTLPHAGYGQGEVVVSPLKLARVSASIASGGMVVGPSWIAGSSETEVARRFLPAAEAARLARAMRGVVTTGTGRVLSTHPVAIAGKTGSAELGEGEAHAWFTGFAPHDGAGRRIAFAVIVEHAGYGGRVAAPIAGELVAAASEYGLIK